jgi:hypothetical protein
MKAESGINPPDSAFITHPSSLFQDLHPIRPGDDDLMGHFQK